MISDAYMVEGGLPELTPRLVDAEEAVGGAFDLDCAGVVNDNDRPLIFGWSRWSSRGSISWCASPELIMDRMLEIAFLDTGVEAYVFSDGLHRYRYTTFPRHGIDALVTPACGWRSRLPEALLEAARRHQSEYAKRLAVG